MSPRMILAAVLTAVTLCAAGSTAALACEHCGCAAPCQKTCRLVCETKKVEITCWGCKCEDFCVPGPSKPCCKHCEMVCDDCDQCAADGVHYQPHKFVWTEWIPGCAKIHTRKKLMKKTVTKTVPSYKWVVENLCPQCQTHAQSVSVPAGTELPQLPALASQAAVMPVGTLPPGVVTTVSSESEEELFDVQPASFSVPPQIPVHRAPAATPPAPKSWQDSFKLPWQR